MPAVRSDSVKPDLDLLAAANAGDFSAFEEIVRRYRDRLYRLAYGMTGSAADAEDIVQDSFLGVFRSLRSFRGESSVASWIYRIGANAALMRLRSKRRKPLLSVDDELPDETAVEVPAFGQWALGPEAKLLNRELSERISTAVAALPDKYRLVLLLRDVEGLSNEEASKVLGLSVQAVKARLHRSRIFVRNELERYYRAQ